MTQSEMLLFVVKLISGGLAAFFAILLWAKTKEVAWMCIVAGAVTRYVGVVYDMMVSLGIFLPFGITLFQIPVITLICIIVPDLFFVIGFIIKVSGHK